ncbi:hypothetical protein DH2020_012309 [Rehmannia glutinosa]|uniref:POX domain-containing protein n=1 Tax=Rehmannia glutinosa TaxID=99300 RepID=A0ABR0X2V6_REHGL
MSQDYHHQGIFSFSNGLERHQQQQQQQHQQIRRDKLSVHGFMEEEEETGGLPVYETGGPGTMMSEIFNFPSDGAVSATELLETQISQSYRNSRAAPPTSAADWFSHRINADSEAAMQLFPTPPNSTSSTLHMLLPNPSSSSSFGQFTWFENNNINNPNEIPPGVVEGQRLSLSLSSSLQHMGGGAGLHLHGGVSHNRHSSNFTAAASMLRNSKYAKAAQDLLEEFCSVGRGQFKKKPNNNRNPSGGGGGGDGNAAQDHPPLSASDRLEHQRRKALIHMIITCEHYSKKSCSV